MRAGLTLEARKSGSSPKVRRRIFLPAYFFFFFKKMYAIGISASQSFLNCPGQSPYLCEGLA